MSCPSDWPVESLFLPEDTLLPPSERVGEDSLEQAWLPPSALWLSPELQSLLVSVTKLGIREEWRMVEVQNMRPLLCWPGETKVKEPVIDEKAELTSAPKRGIGTESIFSGDALKVGTAEGVPSIVSSIFALEGKNFDLAAATKLGSSSSVDVCFNHDIHRSFCSGYSSKNSSAGKRRSKSRAKASSSSAV